jgi:hypothetical protein
VGLLYVCLKSTEYFEASGAIVGLILRVLNAVKKELTKSLSYGRFKRTLFRTLEQLDISLVERQLCAIEF